MIRDVEEDLSVSSEGFRIFSEASKEEFRQLSINFQAASGDSRIQRVSWAFMTVGRRIRRSQGRFRRLQGVSRE